MAFIKCIICRLAKSVQISKRQKTILIRKKERFDLLIWERHRQRDKYRQKDRISERKTEIQKDIGEASQGNVLIIQFKIMKRF